jgi:hypothetical protein
MSEPLSLLQLLTLIGAPNDKLLIERIDGALAECLEATTRTEKKAKLVITLHIVPTGHRDGREHDIVGDVKTTIPQTPAYTTGKFYAKPDGKVYDHDFGHPTKDMFADAANVTRIDRR